MKNSRRIVPLRRKIDDGSALHLIHTIRGVGYELSGRGDVRQIGGLTGTCSATH